MVNKFFAYFQVYILKIIKAGIKINKRKLPVKDLEKKWLFWKN